MADDSRRSLGTLTPPWVRVAMPSTADLIFVALLTALVFTPLSVRLLGDAGIGWHIRAGQQILATHTIPRVDSFSSTMGGKAWFAWEWLYDLVVGGVEAILGLNGVVWFTALVIAGVFAWTFRLLILRGTNLLIALVLVLFAISAAMIHFLARPHVVSWLFTLAWFWILQSCEKKSPDGRGFRRGRVLWLLPLLMLVWVNVHGGFLVGFVLLGIFWAGALWDWACTKQGRIEDLFSRIAARKRARTLVGVGLMSLAASLANPYGWKLHAHVYSYLSNRFLMDHIEEFRSPDFHGVAQKCFLILVLITLAALAAHGRGLRMSEMLTVLLAVFTGMYASRNIPVSSLLLVMVIGPLLSPVRLGQRFFEKMTAVESGLRGHLWPILAVALTFLIAVNGGRPGSSVLMDAHFDPSRMPVEAVDYLQTQKLAGPVLSPDYWGGYLIYRLYPGTKVVIDDRHDLYGEEFLKSYLKMMKVQPGWKEFLQEHQVRCLVLAREAALTNLLLEMQMPLEKPDWIEVYGDDTAVVLVRAGPDAARKSAKR